MFRKALYANGGRLLSGVKVSIRGDFTIGKDVVIGAKGIDLFSHSQIISMPLSKLIIGNQVGMTSVSIFCKERIEIGDYVNIGAGCLIIDSDFHAIDWRVRKNRIRDVQESKNAPIKIGNYAFIGARCIILKGVTIGERSIIGAGSVVSDDIPSDCIAAGNPCKIIKYIK